jgi:hypothetical protein
MKRKIILVSWKILKILTTPKAQHRLPGTCVLNKGTAEM